MSDNDFETRVLPVIRNLGRKLFGGDEQREQDAVGNGWYMYQLADDRLAITATTFARFAVAWVYKGRDLPGTGGAGNQLDALDRPDTVWAGDMGGTPDWSPGPERIVEARERLERFSASLTPRDMTIVRGLADGLPGRDIAREIGVTQGRLSQLKQALRERLRG